jgi:serine/threonine-protein kinase HipA
VPWVVNTWRTHFEQAGVSAGDLQTLAERIDGDELLGQRTGFDPARFQRSPVRRKRPGPFRDTSNDGR